MNHPHNTGHTDHHVHQHAPTPPPVDIKKLEASIFSKMVLFLLIMPLIFFLPAGTIFFYEAWAYIAILFIPAIGVMIYFLKKDPALLERRMRMKEKEQTQKYIIMFGTIFFLVSFFIPGFDFRYEWSSVPLALVMFADAMILLGYGLFILVLKENSHASRIIEVEKGQKVISTGPYAVVRHPMYVAILIIYGFTPIALGSYYGLIPVAAIPVVLILRILNEEKVLAKNLEGYVEYMKKVRYRLIPGIW